MANKLALGLVIGGAVSSTVGAAFKDVTNRIKSLEAQGAKARVLQNTIGDTIRLREEWRKAHASGDKGASALLKSLEANLSSLKKQGVEVGRLAKAYDSMGKAAAAAELKAVGHKQLDEGRQGLKSSVGQAAAATAVLAVPTKVSADYGAIVRDIAIKANIANKPEEGQMSQKIIQTSRDTGMARNQVAEVVNALVGAGMELDKALAYAPTAAKFAVGQGSDGGETAKMINALGQNAKITDPAMMQQALEAIAYQGQAGSFEAADMAKWFPELLAGMGKLGITGMDSVTQLGAMLQVQMKTAGGSDEAAGNLKNWMEKIGSGDTVKAYQDAGIDYQASMNTGLQNGMSTLESSFALAQKYIVATDPKKAAAMAEATAKISKETDPEKAKAMLASLEQALRTGDLFADMQVKGALTAYMQNKDLYDQLKKDSASATGILDKNLEERRQSSAQKWAEMAQGMDDAMRGIGDAFRPATDAVASGLTYVTQGLAKLSDESPRVVMGIGAAVAAVIAFQAAMSSFKIAKGLLNVGRGSLLGNPNIPQKVIVTNLPAGGVGGLDGSADATGKKGGKGGRSGGGRGVGIGAAVKGAGVLAVVNAGYKAIDTYQNAETQDEKAEGYGEAAGGLAGTLAGAAAGAAIGSVVPVIGTAIGGVVGGVLGNMGGDALGGYAGKSLFGADDAQKTMPIAGPLMMANAGQDIPPVLGDIRASFQPGAATPAPLMLAAPSVPTPGVQPGAAVQSAPALVPLSVAAPSAVPAIVAPKAIEAAKPTQPLTLNSPATLTPIAPQAIVPGAAVAPFAPQAMDAKRPAAPQTIETKKPAVPQALSPLKTPAPLMMLPEAETRPGDVVRAIEASARPPAAASAAPIAQALKKADAKPAEPPKIEQVITITAPLTVTVQGDVKDPAQLARELQPYIAQQQRDIVQQLESRKLYDAPHI